MRSWLLLLAALPHTAFQHPERVTIVNYTGDAMEPFVTHDGRYLLFNNSNDAAVNTNLHFAGRIDDLHFIYRGEIRGVNTPALEGVASVSCGGDLYFVSTRSYTMTYSTIYRARFSGGVAAGIELVPGISRHMAGWVNFDAEISADGQTMYAVDSRFSAHGTPQTADLFTATRHGDGFVRSPDSDRIMKMVNSGELEYAPAVSSDERELFFTRVREIRPDAKPQIWRAVRPNAADPFGAPSLVSAIQGFAEGPALSPDGQSLYYHVREKGRFAIFRVTRPAAPPGVRYGCP